MIEENHGSLRELDSNQGPNCLRESEWNHKNHTGLREPDWFR